MPSLEQRHALLAVPHQPGAEADIRHDFRQQQPVLVLLPGDEDAIIRLSGSSPDTSPVPAAAGGMLAAASSSTISTGSSTRKVEPWPGVLSRLIEPPISPVSRRAIASPRPMPLCVPGSANCMKGWNTRFRSSGAMPGPVSSTSTIRWPASPCRVRSRMVTLPSSVNFTALPARLSQDLAQPRLVALDEARKRHGLLEPQGQALLLRPDAHRTGDLLHKAAEVEGCYFELQAAGLDLGHVQHLVNEGQEMLAAAL